MCICGAMVHNTVHRCICVYMCMDTKMPRGGVCICVYMCIYVHLVHNPVHLWYECICYGHKDATGGPNMCSNLQQNVRKCLHVMGVARQICTVFGHILTS